MYLCRTVCITIRIAQSILLEQEQSPLRPLALIKMCHTSYKRYRYCDCIYIRESPTRCLNFVSEHPESHYAGPFKPKLLTWICENLDVDLNDINFMSADVNDERAPKGLTCPTITAVPDIETAVEGCPLCDNGHTLAIVLEKLDKTKSISANSVEKSAGKLVQKVTDERAKADRKGTEQNEEGKWAERHKPTPMDEPKSILDGRSRDEPARIHPQSSTSRESHGNSETRTNSKLMTKSGGSPSSIGFNTGSSDPHCLDP